MIVVAMEEEKHLIPTKPGEHCIVTGVGAVNIFRSLKDVPRDEPILNVGYAGSNRLPQGTVVQISKAALYHPNAEYDEPVFELDGDVPCYTSCDFVTSTDIVEPCVFDMELAFILAMGFTDVQAVKVVSDMLDKEEYDDFLSKAI